MTVSDFPVVPDRRAVSAPGAAPVPGTTEAPTVTHEELAVLRLAGHIQAGDQGAILRFVNQLEHRRGQLVADPWRVIEHMALRLIRSHAPAPEAGTDDGT
jgi:hypothetical protein